MKLFVSIAVYLFYSCCAQPISPNGPYKVKNTTIYIGNLKMGGSQNASLFYPAANVKDIFPLISFAHGALAGGSRLPIDYYLLLHSIASYGYVVVAAESCPVRYCPNFYIDVLDVIDVCKENPSLNPIFSQTDFNNVGIVGHSMGGTAAEKCSEKSNALPYNIKAVVALNPYICVDCTKTTNVPLFIGTGTADSIANSTIAQGEFNEIPTTVPRVYADIINVTHFEPNIGTKWNGYVASFLNCYLKSNKTQPSCNDIFDRKNPSSLCNAYPMQSCIVDPS